MALVTSRIDGQGIYHQSGINLIPNRLYASFSLNQPFQVIQAFSNVLSYFFIYELLI